MNLGSLLCSSKYSPTAPNSNNAPDANIAISDIVKPVSVADFDKEKKYPISPHICLEGSELH